MEPDYEYQGKTPDGVEVIIQQTTKPCFIIDIRPDEVCTINNLMMLFKGPNKDEDMGW